MKYLIAAIVLLLYSLSAHAEVGTIGKFGGDVYGYDTVNIERVDNTVGVWILTRSKKYNYMNHNDYSFFAGKFIIDCSGRGVAFVAGTTFNKKGEAPERKEQKEEEYKFYSIKAKSVVHPLFIKLCVNV